MTKIDIISGFLGAGKTTFIKKMIEEVFKGEKILKFFLRKFRKRGMRAQIPVFQKRGA